MKDWEESNNHYLTVALAWLCLRLRLFAQGHEPEESPPGKVNLSDCLFHRKDSSEATSRKHVSQADVERAARDLAEAVGFEPRPALWRLSESLGLSFFEQEILLLCAAMELDMGTASLCAYAQNSLNNPYPTFALALALFDHLTKEEEKSLSKAFYLPETTSPTSPAWEAFSANGALRYWRLIEINQVGAQPLTTSPLRADEWVVNYIKGLTHLLDDRLEPLSIPFDVSVDAKLLPASQQQVVQAILNYLERTEHNGHAPVVQLVGADPISKQLIAGQVALLLRRFLVRLPVELLPAQMNDLETVARLWQRESMLLPFVLYLDAHEMNDLLAGNDGQVSVLHRFLAKNPGLVLLDTREVQPGLGFSSIPVDVEKPTPAEQQSAWDEALGAGCEEITSQLAGQFNLNTPTISHIAKLAKAADSANQKSLQDVIWQASLQSTRPRLDKLAQRLEPKADWDSIVLPVETRKLLEQVTDQVQQRSKVYDEWGFRSRMNRGLGISALFAGDSGTGKTMAAEVIARVLKLNLYRIDLSAVVSKYIGETEKNLRQVFDAAEDGGAILFFDEADALFGKRSEVKDSHDRYANIEINYLLQRMEAYRGLAILATNMRNALDPAFQRRLRFIVNFLFPGPAERTQIWKKVFPQTGGSQPDRSCTPLEVLDYEYLARFNLTGGSIHNVALNAAFLAARAGIPVTMPLLIIAVRTELRKLEKAVSEADFRLPDAVRTSRENWQLVLTEQGNKNRLTLTGIDFDRLAWFTLNSEEITGITAKVIDACLQAQAPITMPLLMEEITKFALKEKFVSLEVLYR